MPPLDLTSLIFSLKSFFISCPPAKAVFGFPVDMDPEDMPSNKKFLAHAAMMMQMLDKALNMLGPDVELLAEILCDRKFYSVQSHGKTSMMRS